MPDEARKYFTLEEAERLIPQLQGIVGRVMDRHAEVTRLRNALQEAQRDVMLAGGMRLHQEFWRTRKAALGRATAELRSRIAEILNMGAVPKDLGMGLVDFPSFLDDQEINLCWRFGEQRIRFWHGLDEGYANRRPLPGASGETQCP